MPTLLIRNADILVTMDDARREIPDGGFFARDGIIEQVGPTSDLPTTADEVIDASGQVVLPGLINCHHHLDQTLTRNLPAAQNTNLFPWLRVHYRIWAAKTPDELRNAVMLGCAELALSGCTTVFDQTYIFQNGCRLDDEIDGARASGLRFVASRGSMSLGESQGGLPPDDCTEDESHILRDSVRLIERYHDPSPGAMLQIVLAPCSPFSVTPSLMRESAAIAREYDVRLHTHLCETIDEERFTLDRFGLRPVDYLETLEWGGGDVWYAHAIHVNDDEIRRFSHGGTGVCHCPSSNMRLASGIAPVRKYRNAGVKVGLGVDGSASNDGNHMLLEARMAMLIARLQMGLRPPEGPDTDLLTSDPRRAAEWMTAREALEIATLGGASVLGRTDIGALRPGMCADCFTVDLGDVTYAGALSDPVAAVLFSSPTRAKHTIVHGRVVVRDGHLTTMDLPRVIEDHNRAARRLVAAAG